MSLVVLGLNAYHGDSSACLLANGKLIVAAEEERFRRIKHWAGFPSEAISHCFKVAGIRLDDVDCVAVNHDPRANLRQKLAFVLHHRPSPKLILARIRKRRRRASISLLLDNVVPGQSFRGQVHHVEHHLAHVASAFLVSPFDQAVAASVDGFGDFASAGWGVGRGDCVELERRLYFPHSLGVFYEAMTQYLGFTHWGDEYKVMGLAPYGEPQFRKEMRQIVKTQNDGTFQLDLKYFRHHAEKIEYAWEGGAPNMGRLFAPALEELLGPARGTDEPLTQHHKDIARSVQVIYEETFLHLLNSLHARFGLESLVLAGGCAMNSVANGKITKATPFRKVYVQAAAGDAGGAIGAAMVVWHRLNGSARRSSMEHAYWGPAFGDEEIEELLLAKNGVLSKAGCVVSRIVDENKLCAKTAEAIAGGKVIGWFQGRMEWGPRALGNRSIVADPRRRDMKDILNHKIKRRESFRPFAPSILREAVGEWFETDDDVPFMEKVFVVREARRERIPAVVHVDGTARLQTVTETSNTRYYRLIDEFRKLTGVPMLLNTSFNENEPIVCRPEEALDCFLRTKMDVLVLGNWYIERTNGRP